VQSVQSIPRSASPDAGSGTDAEPVRLRTEQIAGLWSLLPSYAASTLLACVMIALMCWSVVAPSRIAAWFATTVLLSALLVVVTRRLCAPGRVAAVGPDRPLRLYLVMSTAFAAVQAAALWWVVPAELPYVLAYGMLTVATLIGAPLQFGYLPVGVSFGVVSMTSLAARLFSLGDPFAIGLGVACLVFLVPYTDGLVRSRRVWVETFQARFRNEALARRLEQSVVAEVGARRAAQRADDAKTRFLAAASHDLRQPVHAGGLLAAALAAEPLTPRAAALSAQLGRTLTGLDSLLGRLLDISRFDAGHVPVQPAPVEVGAIVEQVVARFAPLAEHKGLALRARRGRPAWAHSDPVLLGQVVANLVSNAVRHTERGGVLVGVRRRGDVIVVEVVDSGPGIPAEHREAIFEEFVQLGAGARDRREGLGLGLAIVRRLCERLGHACAVASTPGRGSRFSVTIARLADPDRPVAAAVTDADVAADVAGALVLVVDDDANVLAGTDAALRAWGAETLLADSVDAAVAAVDACERWPDVILTDHRFAGAQTGLDVVRRIAASTDQPLPAIVMSADLDESLERRVLEQGAVLLRKPVDPRTLRARIADARRVAIAGAAR
jgi:signal transduction histidine kinase